MSEYLIINILIIIVPLLLSFEKKIKYYKKFPQLLISIIIVGGAFIIWDSAAANRGDWMFNSEFTIGLKIFDLPLEEILFFITVPYSTIFIYETGKFYLTKTTKKNFHIDKSIFLFLSFMFLFLSYNFSDQYYTFTVLIFCSVFLLIAVFFFKDLLESKLYWIFILVSYLPFLLVNYFLTSLPIVLYNPKAIWGLRFVTIPVEDFFYSFSLISFYLLVYLKSERLWKRS